MDSKLEPYVGRLCRDNEGNLYRIVGFMRNFANKEIYVLLQDFVTQSCLYLEENWWYVRTSCDEWKVPWTWA